MKVIRQTRPTPARAERLWTRDALDALEHIDLVFRDSLTRIWRAAHAWILGVMAVTATCGGLRTAVPESSAWCRLVDDAASMAFAGMLAMLMAIGAFTSVMISASAQRSPHLAFGKAVEHAYLIVALWFAIAAARAVVAITTLAQEAVLMTL